MRRFALAASFLLAMFTAIARADRSTPFLEGPASALNAVSDAQVYILDTGPNHIVLVSTDTGKLIPILATAAPGIVSSDFLGRPVTIKAQITKRPATPKADSGEGFELKILSVQIKTPAPASGSQPAK